MLLGYLLALQDSGWGRYYATEGRAKQTSKMQQKGRITIHCVSATLQHKKKLCRLKRRRRSKEKIENSVSQCCAFLPKTCAGLRNLEEYILHVWYWTDKSTFYRSEYLGCQYLLNICKSWWTAVLKDESKEITWVFPKVSFQYFVLHYNSQYNTNLYVLTYINQICHIFAVELHNISMGV